MINLLRLLLLLLSPVLAWGMEPASHGVLDLRQWDGQEAVSLEGEWAVTWQRPPGDAITPASFISVPGLWNASYDSGRGMATYALQIKLPPAAPSLSLRIPHILSANRVLINGQLLAETGWPAPDAAEEEPRYLTRIVPVPEGQAVLELRIQVSNHFHFEGGLGNTLYLAPAGLMERNWQLRQLLFAGVISSLLLMALYIAVFSRHSSASSRTYLTLLLLDMALRLLCTSEILKTIVPDINEELALRLEYLPIYISWPAYFFLLHSFFPSCLQRWVGALLTTMGAVGLAAVLVLPVEQFTSYRDLTSLAVVASSVYFSICVLRAAYQRQPGALLLGLGMIAALMATVHDALMYSHLFSGTDLAPIGILFFLFSHFVELGRRVGQSLEDVRHLSAELVSVNAGLEAEVNQRTQEIQLAMGKLNSAKVKAEVEAQTKSLFLANISHEVRTPINVILGMVRLLRQQPREPDRARYMRVMEQTGRNLVHLLDNILDLSRLEAGKAELSPQATSLEDFFQELAEIARFQCDDKGLTFTCNFTGLEQPVLADTLRLNQILSNLLGNSIKFTQLGQVNLLARGSKTDKGLRLLCEVSDTGPGISPEAREHIFEDFGRDPRTAHLKGTGLGLAIVRRLALLMHGDLSVHEAPGGGACFRLEVELELSQAPPQALAPPRHALPSVRHLKLLLVEDTPENCLLIQEYLAPGQHEITVAPCGGDALYHLERVAFDIVLLDMRLGDMPGEAVAEAIRLHPESRISFLPIIAITANVSPEDRQRYAAVGVDEVLSKPLDLDALLDALARHAPAAPSGEAMAEKAEAESETGTRLAARSIENARPVFIRACQECLALLEQGRQQAAPQQVLLATTHRLRGSAATFGESHLEHLASTLEQHIHAGLAIDHALTALQSALEQILAQAPAEPSLP
ncbi:MAG TPA: ATP-binding protein [Azospira sp.]|nr:ATP-binding protein [Azospira sp.]